MFQDYPEPRFLLNLVPFFVSPASNFNVHCYLSDNRLLSEKNGGINTKGQLRPNNLSNFVWCFVDQYALGRREERMYTNKQADHLLKKYQMVC